MTIRLHRGDLPDLSRYSGPAVAVDTEAMGLDPKRDRRCVVQLSPGDGSADVVQIPAYNISAPNLKKLMSDTGILKIFHFALFDIGMIFNTLVVMPEPIYCTRTASRLGRTYTDKHGLKDLARELLGVVMSQQQQTSDWGAPSLSDAQLA
jgi:ribonuclease D